MPMLPALCNTGKLEYKQQILVNCVWVVGWEFIEIVNCHWHLSFAEHWQYNKLDHDRLRRIVSNGVNPNSSFTLAEPDSETDTDCMKFYCQWVSVSANTSMQFHTSHLLLALELLIHNSLTIKVGQTWEERFRIRARFRSLWTNPEYNKHNDTQYSGTYNLRSLH